MLKNISFSLSSATLTVEDPEPAGTLDEPLVESDSEEDEVLVVVQDDDEVAGEEEEGGGDGVEGEEEEAEAGDELQGEGEAPNEEDGGQEDQQEGGLEMDEDGGLGLEMDEDDSLIVPAAAVPHLPSDAPEMPIPVSDFAIVEGDGDCDRGFTVPPPIRPIPTEEEVLAGLEKKKAQEAKKARVSKEMDKHFAGIRQAISETVKASNESKVC